MLIRNSAERFGLVARTLHWLTLVLLIGSFSLAVSMVNMPFSPRKLEFYSWHKWVGVTIFLVVLLRLAWRLVNPVPLQPSGQQQWQRRLAGLSHAALYAILIVMPITGWIMSSALNLPVVYLGLDPYPEPVRRRPRARRDDEDRASVAGGGSADAGDHPCAGSALSSPCSA